MVNADLSRHDEEHQRASLLSAVCVLVNIALAFAAVLRLSFQPCGDFISEAVSQFCNGQGLLASAWPWMLGAGFLLTILGASVPRARLVALISGLALTALTFAISPA